MPNRPTRFSDVCGTIDELLTRLRNEYDQVAEDPEGELGSLVDDALAMIRHMARRRAEYGELQVALRGLLEGMEAVEDPPVDRAERAAGLLHDAFKSSEAFRGIPAGEVEDAAERIRKVAGDFENRLRQCKEQVLRLHEEFLRVKGGRPWLVDEGDKPSYVYSLQKEHQAWLPPEPHRKELIDWLTRDRAAISETRLPDGQPVVQFEDGGEIPMSQVRWDPEVRNFHPASFRPDPRARRRG
ncbi:MAG: hypothetical protein QGI83_03385 [Candidatus Latescibacteria bacterium]|nr:hypothetical protein [Candidatus Latescibacterota bacterium]